MVKALVSRSSGLKMGTSEFNARGNPAMDKHPIQGGVEILLATSCHRNRRYSKLWPDGSLGSYAGFTFTYLIVSVRFGYIKMSPFLSWT